MRGAQERALLFPDNNIVIYGSCTIIKMKTTVVVVLNKYRLVYNSIFLSTVCCIQKYSTQQVQTAVHPPTYYLYMVCSNIESNSVLVADGNTTSAVSPTRREELDQNTYGLRNR